MAKFITGEDLEKAISSIIWDAKKTLLIVSPFIKLDEYFKKLFEKQKSNCQLHLLVLFGKNEQDKSKSLNTNDFEFFKSFPFVSIIYVPNLHAKYYGNETKGVITSINMYDHSFKNNIEFGVYSENNLLDKFTQSSDQDAWNKCKEIAQKEQPVYIKRPVFKKKLISLMGKDFMTSQVLLDNTDSIYGYKKNNDSRKLADFPDEIDFEQQSNLMPTREEIQAKPGVSSYHQNSNASEISIGRSQMDKSRYEGYCIRTGTKIAFNPQRPYCYDAYKSWAQFENIDYSENYCHKTGKKSFGKTSMRNPILYDN